MEWEVLGNIVNKRKSLFEELHCFDEKEAAGALSVDEMERKNVVAIELEKIHLWKRFLGVKNLGPFG